MSALENASRRKSVATREEPRLSYVRALSLSGFHRIAVWEWGTRDPNKVPIVCAHGLTRQARDFDVLARRLVRQGRHVICPDLAGRGHSDWLRDPGHYNLLQYAADMNTVLAGHGGDKFDWVGSSLGGLVGMILAAHSGAPIRRLVLNDVGPYIPSTALRRIGAYVSTTPPTFATLDDAEAHLRKILMPFGDLTDAQWKHLAMHSFHRTPDQRAWVSRHDPAIASTYRLWQFMSVDMWSTWNQVTCPTLVIRGMDSDFLLPHVARRMQISGPRATVLEIPGCGHAPALMDDRQIEPLTVFLETASLAPPGGVARSGDQPSTR